MEGSSRGGLRRIASFGPRGLYPGKEGSGEDIVDNCAIVLGAIKAMSNAN